MLNTIEEVLAELRAGRPVLVTDDADRENEGDAILAAELADPRWVGWMVRHTSGYLCAPMTEERADQLDLPLMWPASQDPLRTRYTVAVDAAHGITTGIDAVQRARTARVLADPSSTPSDLVRPGHVLPLRARAGGVLERRGHTEAAVDLARLAGLEPVGLIGELVGDDGMCLRADAIADLARTEGLALTTIDQLAQWRQAHDPGPAVPTQRVTALAKAHLPPPPGPGTRSRSLRRLGERRYRQSGLFGDSERCVAEWVSAVRLLRWTRRHSSRKTNRSRSPCSTRPTSPPPMWTCRWNLRRQNRCQRHRCRLRAARCP